VYYQKLGSLPLGAGARNSSVAKGTALLTSADADNTGDVR
jgi:hypothetical protein